MSPTPTRKPRSPFKLRTFALAAAALVLLACGLACDDDDDGFGVGPFSPVIGGPCVDDLDCVSGSYCLRGGDFPEGTCTIPCSTSSQCSAAAACIDKDRGVCLLECFRASDCRGGYSCKEEDERDGNGKSRVCIH